MRKAIYAILVFLFVLSFGCEVEDDEPAIEEGPATIRGKVMLVSCYTPDYIRPLNGAVVRTEPATKEVLTGADGEFGIAAPNGKYRLIVKGEENEPSFITWVVVSDDFHPNVTVPLRESDEGLVVYEAILTNKDTKVIDEDCARSMFPVGTKEVYFLMDHDALGEEDMVDVAWLKGTEEIMRIEDVDLPDIDSPLFSSVRNATRFSMSSGESMPEGHYSVQVLYRKFASKSYEEPQVVLSLPFYVRGPEPEEPQDLPKETFSITVLNERGRGVKVHLDGDFKFSLMGNFVQEKWRKQTIHDVPMGEHTITVFDEWGNLIGSDTFVLDSDVTITIKP